jgi:hypothetical protein
MALLRGALDSNVALDHELDRQTSNKSPSLAHGETELHLTINYKFTPTSGPPNSEVLYSLSQIHRQGCQNGTKIQPDTKGDTGQSSCRETVEPHHSTE